jgi:glycosyltransferase involved in cell wall biosynthesis
MKIVHVIPALTKGGAERVVVDLANHAVEAGHEVTIVAAVPAPPELIANRLSSKVRLRYVGKGSIRRSYGALFPWLRRNRSWLLEQDVIHAHLTFGSVFAALFQRMRRRQDRPAVVETYHAVGMAIPARERALHAALLSGRDVVIFMANDPFWCGYAERHPKTLFQTIPNAIAAPAAIKPSQSERFRLERTSLPSSTTSVVGSVGRLVPARRPDLLLEAFAEIASALGPEAHLLLAGEGAERGALEAESRRLGIATQVHMPGLVLEPSEPIGLMDLYLTVNVGGITGIAALEAAFLGVPVIALQLQEAYEPKESDWIWSSHDPKQLGAKAVSLLSDREALRSLGARQQAHARTNFSVDAMAQAYEDLYQQALERVRGA